MSNVEGLIARWESEAARHDRKAATSESAHTRSIDGTYARQLRWCADQLQAAIEANQHAGLGPGSWQVGRKVVNTHNGIEGEITATSGKITVRYTDSYGHAVGSAYQIDDGHWGLA